tara:strand:+ start:1920 stop:2432 length:513 start_codon:yes stop_codon:yes gene_type:complete
MKKFLLGLCILGLTNLISAQNDLAMATANDNDITIKTSKIKNESYLMSNTNETKQLAVRIKKLQKIAAAYDISKESIYSKKKSITYDVVFEANENYIKAVYDHNGVIISSEEYYEDVRIPYVLTSQLAKDYPGWSFDKSNCKIFYSKEGESKFTYKIVLKKGNKSKLITR